MFGKKEKGIPAPVVGYKAFNEDFKCRGFQYEIGKEYTHKGDIAACKSGFHFCRNPLDVLSFYDLVGSKFAVVEALGDVQDEENKSVTNKLRVTAELGLTAFVEASVKFLWESCSVEPDKKAKKTDRKATDEDDAQLASSGNDARLASSGYGAQLASSGYGAQLASSGNGAQLASSGYGAQLASSGYGAQLASSGNDARLASSGYGAQLASSGYGAQLASSGNDARLASSGNDARLASSGNDARLALDGTDSIGAGIGICNIIKGKKGNWIVLAEFDDNYKVVGVVSGQIDGKKLKEDTFYKAEGGKFVEA